MCASDTVPLVSIVIPTYNHAHFIGEALASVSAQTYTNWEAIVINNHSTDNTVEIVGGFRDARIRMVDFHNHGVIAASRNRGISLAAGKYIAFLDSDDKWRPTKLARCVAELEAGPAQLVCHGEDWVWEDGSSRTVMYGPADRFRYDSLLYRGNCLSTSAVVASREAILAAGCFSEDTRLITAEDYDLWLRLSRRGTPAAIIPEVLGEYRLHAGNSIKAVRRNLDAVLAVLAQHFAAEGPVGLPGRIRRNRRVGFEHYVAARAFMNAGERGQALSQLMLALRTFPFSLRAAATLAVALLLPTSLLQKP